MRRKEILKFEQMMREDGFYPTFTSKIRVSGERALLVKYLTIRDCEIRSFCSPIGFFTRAKTLYEEFRRFRDE